MIQEGGIAGPGVGETLRLKMVKKFTARDNFSINQARRLFWNDTLHKVELEKEEHTNFTWTLNRCREPLEKYAASRFCQVKYFARRADTLGFQLRFDIL